MQYLRTRSFLPLLPLLSIFYVISSHATQLPEISGCGQNAEALQLAKLIIQDPGQERSTIRCNELLSKVAMEKARDMADFGIVRHNLGGSPNSRLREAGFTLPHYYGGAMSNQVEAIAGGYSTAEKVWRAFKGSAPHRSHLLGDIDFYREQDQLGVGFFRDNGSAHVEYWVVYLAKHRDEQPPVHIDDVPNKGIDILTPQDAPDVTR